MGAFFFLKGLTWLPLPVECASKGSTKLPKHEKCTRKITLLAPSGISAIDAKERAEVAAMIGEYILAGFEVSIQH
ncbi:hypothetical protein [Pseudomonas phage vB_PaeM_PAO1_Ab17]|uniref:Uncharacterized protein n=1 Tax=Pseudomonas phage vB_PaeM_PAO1_Ab17 TaxID=1548904 RepID=A0A0A1IVR1_9CAUD|nr:hypothetical protein [Pseudomonas phage vB_PaeM_PAO1_Ab17]